MSHQVIHWEIGATDLDKERTFYAELFGWQITTSGPEYALVPASSPGIGGGIMQVSRDIPPYLTVYVQVSDLEAMLARALHLGATQVVAPTPIAGVGRFALFADPDGHLMGLLEPIPTSEPDTP